MPKLTKRLTDNLARTLPAPAEGFALYWCRDTPGLALRVTAAGARAYVAERRVDGKTVRRTLGRAVGAAAISADAARRLQIEVSSELQQGVDRAAVKALERKAEKADALTLADALRAYVKGKRRGKDGLALKASTQAEYLAMIEPDRCTTRGRTARAGALHDLADKPLRKLSGDDMRELHKRLAPRGARRQTYALQVLRAVLNWHGVQVHDSPLAKSTAGRDRIILAPTSGNPRPIPPEKLGAWWRAACALAGDPAADGLRFMLLTGARPGEVFGGVQGAGILARDVDLDGGRVVLHDTKNRKDHTLLLSRQALDVLKPHATGKKPGARAFQATPHATMRAISAEAGVQGLSPHKLRHTFASIAAELVSAFAVKAMLNHSAGGDVTAMHYVGQSEAQLRAAWQTVADFIAAVR
ncbi:tyrosine-type recombinase/integrase [Rubrivivax gelatinosus]|uniref:Tyr recombinase domain-containing protein n=1 Tax=Rubrivivax gelatinosus TaxID=28068 RepID=A0ABS1E129_RUBGE|nr:tyrosine-type recombinase/integrase [Rubrivivax gelatinosus]MBK1714645.1 hypothetical protein [Rubrivivax gelatinosus]